MDFIGSKNIFLLTRDTLKLMDKRLMKHGSRVAYILYKMMQVRGGYEEYEMAEFAMLATIHDIGAYRTADLSMPLSFETKNTQAHSIYGYLFLKYLSPYKERAKVLLNHHAFYSDLLKKGEKEYLEVTSFLSLAEYVDVYREALGERFNVLSFRPFEGKRFSKLALDVLDRAIEKYQLFEKLETEDHEIELSKLMDNLMFTNQEKKEYMETIMYCLDFRSHMKVQDTAVCISICDQIAEMIHLDVRTREKLYYGALIHDIGMLDLPKDMIESNRKLTEEEMERMRGHVQLTRTILESRMEQDVTEIAVRHHERCNGAGYPNGLVAKDMTVPEKILQIADAVTGMINDRPYRKGLSNDIVHDILEADQMEKCYDPDVYKCLFDKFDQIISEAKRQGEESLRTNALVDQRYKKLEVAMNQIKG